jgi:membrane-associated protein
LTEAIIFSWVALYGYPLLFFILLLGIIGFPIPDEAVLLYVGTLIAKGAFALLPTFLLSVVAVLSGSLINYYLASLGKQKLFPARRKWRYMNKRWERSIDFVRKYGALGIPVSSFIQGVRMGVSYSAGALKVNGYQYLISSLCGTIIWVSVYLFVGYGIGK